MSAFSCNVDYVYLLLFICLTWQVVSATLYWMASSSYAAIAKLHTRPTPIDLERDEVYRQVCGYSSQLAITNFGGEFFAACSLVTLGVLAKSCLLVSPTSALLALATTVVLYCYRRKSKQQRWADEI